MDDAPNGSLDAPAEPPASFAAALCIWLKIGLLGFGGPAGQIALLHRIVVDEKRWLDERRFLHALNFCMLLPGPEAQQLATYVGWRLHGVAGGLAAGSLFVLPGAVIVLALSMLYAGYRDLALIAAVFYGIKPAVAAIVAEATVRIGRRALKGRALVAIAVAAFVGIFLFDLPFPLIVLLAGLLGLVLPADPRATVPVLGTSPPPVRPLRTVKTVALWLVLWLAPVAAILATFGRDHVLANIATFFSKMAVVTFGGAYAVLAYVAQAAVDNYGWLAPGEMLDGLGLAETTPGPLILVLEFVGFMAAFRDGIGIAPMTAGAIGAGVTLWVTFAPCFLMIFAFAPYIERLYANRRIGRILSAVTAAVVGVILNLALWFLLHVIFRDLTTTYLGPLRLYVPDLSSFDPVSAILAVAAAMALIRFRMPLLPVLAATSVAGAAWQLFVAG